VVITGEVGTGKTLLVRCLLKMLNQANITFAYVFNPRLGLTEFLEYIVGDFGLPTAGKSKSELLLRLSAFLIARHQRNLTTVLVVDEAHHLSAELLEEIRLLTNLETPQSKLLQILLVGQPELDEKLDSTDLRQLKQRIAMRSNLGALDLHETQGYINCRLQLAGCPGSPDLFPNDTVLEVYRQSRGIPRLINTLCENALIQGYASQAKTICPRIIQEIAADFRLNIVHSPKSERIEQDLHKEEVQRAAKTLLELYASLRTAREMQPDIQVAVGAGKHEPYI
jgi:general secretion pathway protein A